MVRSRAEAWRRGRGTRGQTHDESTPHLAARWCWQVARRDDRRSARCRYRTPPVEGVSRLDAGAVWAEGCHGLPRRGVLVLRALGPARRSPGPWCPPDRRACAARAAAACAWRGHPGECRDARAHLPRHRRLARQRRPPAMLEAPPGPPPAREAAAGLTSAFVWCLRGQAVALASGKRTPGGTGGQPTHRKSLCLGCKRL
jgi:hypothetical protein